MDDVRLLEVLDDAVQPSAARSTSSRTGGRRGKPGSTASTWPPTAPRCPSCTAPAWPCCRRSQADRRRPPGSGRDRPGRRFDQRAPGGAVLLHQHLRARRRRPRVGVVNQATGTATPPCGRWGGEGRAGDRALRLRGPRRAIVGISGFPGRHPGWAQFRALGAASLECCAVAEGVLDAYLVVGGARSTAGTTWRAAHLPRGRRGRRRREGQGPDRARRRRADGPIVAATRSWPPGCTEEGL